MTTQTSPPPTQSAPGDRARQLTAVFARALKNALKPITSYPNFAACFPTPASYCDVALRELHSDFVRKLQGTCERKNQELIQEVKSQREEIEGLIAGLEGIVKDVEAANGVLRGGEMEGMEAILKG
ncbi:MAG: hypothetical protein Q9162_000004 [Coniocarpon cinnabarinum]